MINSLPFVSVIIPTRGRPELATLAFDCADNQDYERLEILIFDDEDDPSFIHPFLNTLHPVRYRRFPSTHFNSLGDKRNAMCEDSTGDIIVHVDSDDLSASNRVSTQVAYMTHVGLPVCGFHTLPFYDLYTALSYVYHMSPIYVCGTSLVYTRDFWSHHPFHSVNIGEDLPYTADNRNARVGINGCNLMVALLHNDNTSSRDQVRRHPGLFPPLDSQLLPNWFKEKVMTPAR